MKPFWFVDITRRLSWSRVGDANYFIVSYQGRHVADLFKGKSGWIGVVFGHGNFMTRKVRDATLHIAGMVLHRNQ